MRAPLRLIVLALAMACGAATPAGPALPAPYDALPLRTSGATVGQQDDALLLRFGDDVSWRQALGRLAEDLEGNGWTRDTELPLPGGMAVTFSKAGQTVKALAGGKTGGVKVVVTLEPGATTP